MKSVKFASLIACYFLLVVNVRADLETEETKYIRDGENITLSCSGEINATVTWKFKQTGSSIVIGLANNAVSRNSTKYSATYNGEDGVYNFTVHTFLKVSDAGQYSCLMALNYTRKKEVIFTVIVPATADEKKNTPLGGIIGGVAGGLVVILICIIVLVLFMRRRRLSTKEKKSDVETSNSFGSRNLLHPVEDSTENPMYVKSDVSAEPEAVNSQVKKVNKLPATDVHSQDKKKGDSTANQMYVKSDVSAEPEAVYSQVTKVNKLPATDVHSQDKKKGDSTENPMYVKSDVSAEPEAVYSQVKKVNKLPATDVHSQDKKKGVKTATPHDKDVLVDGARGGENDYKNTASNKSNETEELRNADGLLYADLASAKRKHRDPPLIRGVENTTDYAAIDFTKRAPAPPKEDEGETQN